MRDLWFLKDWVLVILRFWVADTVNQGTVPAIGCGGISPEEGVGTEKAPKNEALPHCVRQRP